MYRKILIAEDHALLRRSIKAICSSENIHGLNEVETCKDLMQVLKGGEYTHLILDFTLADGNALDLIEQIFHNFSSLRVLVYSSRPAGVYGQSLWQRYGIRYISKTEKEPETISQLLAFLRDTGFSQLRSIDPIPTPFTFLTPREKQILQYLLLGWAPGQIAEKLQINPGTVRVQKKSILEKTKTTNILELKELAILYKL